MPKLPGISQRDAIRVFERLGYHVAAHKNAPATSLEMGHDNPQQLFAAYRELVKPTAAIACWELGPAAIAGNLVAFAA